MLLLYFEQLQFSWRNSTSTHFLSHMTFVGDGRETDINDTSNSNFFSFSIDTFIIRICDPIRIERCHALHWAYKWIDSWCFHSFSVTFSISSHTISLSLSLSIVDSVIFGSLEILWAKSMFLFDLNHQPCYINMNTKIGDENVKASSSKTHTKLPHEMTFTSMFLTVFYYMIFWH